MKNTGLLLVVIMVLLVCCRIRKMETLNSPLVTVIKVHAAEALLDFDEAKKYEDVNKIYKDLADSNASPEDCWRNYMTPLNEARKCSKISTNQRQYFEFAISEG